jgi:sec-independent protein translocase protein TatC
MDTPTGGEMPFLDHLEELRWRIIWSVLAVAAGSAIGIFAVFELHVVDVLTAPLYGAFDHLSNSRPEIARMLGAGGLVFNNLTEPFFFVIRVGVAVGFLLAAPVVAYHVWAFFAPALEERERRVIIPSLYLGLGLFAAGVSTGYFVALPITIRFLLGFGAEMFTPLLTADAYLAMVWRLLLVFGLVFELPVVVMILSALGLVTPAFLRSKRRHAIVGLTIAAGVMIPGDTVVLTLLLLVPMVALYEGSILLSALVRRERVEAASLIVPLIVILEGRNRLAASLQRRHGVVRAG